MSFQLPIRFRFLVDLIVELKDGIVDCTYNCSVVVHEVLCGILPYIIFFEENVCLLFRFYLDLQCRCAKCLKLGLCLFSRKNQLENEQCETIWS